MEFNFRTTLEYRRLGVNSSPRSVATATGPPPAPSHVEWPPSAKGVTCCHCRVSVAVLRVAVLPGSGKRIGKCCLHADFLSIKLQIPSQWLPLTDEIN